MKNKFYNNFDCARMTPVKREVEYRTSFQIDRDRIIHSSEFRRLQGKTQVFLPGEYDFYRTRLTHTIEVAQIARSIVNYLTRTYSNYFSEDYFIDPDLVEAAALAHDLGHPPFGHAGERTLNRIMAKYGGFEGNAQTLRLITETFYRSDDSRRGMNPTRAFLDGILKYKSYFTQRKNPHNHFIYDYQKRYVTFAFGSKNVYKELTTVSKLNSFRSIECQIMDWADDTAYAVNDIADSISGGFITMAKLIKFAEQNKSELNKIENECLDELIDWIKRGRFKARLGSLVGEIIRSSKIKTRKTFMDDLTNRYKYELLIDDGMKTKIELYKKLAVELVFRAPQLHQVEFKGDFMIENMFAAFENNYIKSVSDIKLFSTFSDDVIRREKNKMKRARLVCDQLSGMTDSYANKNYKRLFDPDFSSLADLV